MKRILGYVALAAALAALSGCGGSSSAGSNSNILIHLNRTDGTQDMTQYEVYVTRNGNSTFNLADTESFGSTGNRPSWMDNFASTKTTTGITLDYTTRSDQPPYYVFVKVPNTGAAFETVSFSIDVDRTVGAPVTYNLTINATNRLSSVVINRNTVGY